jgi:peptide/nickel transport system ATP-binding protein
MTIDDVTERPGTAAPPTAFLEVRDLRVHFPTEDGLVRAVDGLDFRVERGKTLGIVGESGSGKSVTGQALLGLHKGTRAQVTGEIWVDGKELVGATASEVRALRGNDIAMIFQDPLSSLHPYYSIGDQIVEAYRVHHKDVGKKQAKARAIDMLDRVGIPNASSRVDDYPHQFSGGMRQRAMIAMALVSDPKLLIADEPTTALDVTVQAQILELMNDLQEEFDSAVIVITHDLGVVAEVADDVLVMYGGKAVEKGDVRDLFYRAEMPYTWGLHGSVPRMSLGRQARLTPISGSQPSLINLPTGCAFHPRCRFREHVPEGAERCVDEVPELRPAAPGHEVRCHIPHREREALWLEKVRPAILGEAEVPDELRDDVVAADRVAEVDAELDPEAVDRER